MNYGVSADFAYGAGAGNPTFGLCARCNGGPLDFDFYGLAVNPADPAHITLGYFNEDEIVTLWVKYLVIEIQPDERHNVKFYVHGEDPVTFHFYFDGEKIGSHVETYYLLPEGRAGLAAYEIFETHDIYVDNVTQEDPNTAVAPASLGRLKSVFVRIE